jgi:hypothetical protein
MARHFGILPLFRVVSYIFPVIYFITPFTALLPTPLSQQIAIFILMIAKGSCGIFAFPCSTILLTNSAKSLRLLGTLNGIATSIGAIGRAAGPAICGAAFTWGAREGWIIVPWWVLSVIAAIGAIPGYWLVEMEGFGSVKNDEDEEEEEEEDEIERETAVVFGDDTVRGREEDADIIKPNKNGFSARRLSSPIGMRGDVFGPKGSRKLSNGLGQTNNGQGTGASSFL